jgi:hypothetical protein
MKTSVTDEAVAKYADRVRAGESTKEIFPARMSDCNFTESQRLAIRQARADRKAAQKKAIARPISVIEPKKLPKAPALPTEIVPKLPAPKALSKLRKMLYLQSDRCFFCEEPLKEIDASMERLNPKSRGGTSSEDNLVVCHKSLNETFGAMDLKRKFAFVLKSTGSFKCPKK